LIKTLKQNLKYLDIPDVTNQVFLIILGILSLIFVDQYPDKLFIPVINLVLCLFIIGVVSHYEKKTESLKRKRSFSRFFRFWYPVFTILFCFKEIYLIMIDANKVLYDDVLIKIDQFIFGVNPTEFLSAFLNPYAVEFLQVIYTLFYLMPVIYGMELYLWHRYEEFKFAMFVMLFGFYLSFLGYLLVPAIGPRFTIHDYHQIEIEVPGLFLASILRDMINFGESIPKGISNPEFYAQRDAFPSGHTIIIILITYLSHKIRSKSFYFYLPYTILMIFSTVYLRYHYVIDLIAAIPFVLITIFIANRLYKGRFKTG
jgi:membrane-associated phospholipid phosphatase